MEIKVKATKETGVKWLHRLFNIVWTTQETPEDWRQAILIPIWKKKGSKRDCTKYRGIALLSQTGKIFCKILEKRLRPIIEPQLNESQMGFRKNRSCTDAIFTLRQLVERSTESGKDLHVAFVDQEKAFDRVDRKKLWKILSIYGVNKHLINLCKSLYVNSQCVVRTNTGLSENFQVRSGVRQGCILSPLLFITYVDHICKTANNSDGRNLEELLNELLFADDQVIIAPTANQLQHHINKLNSVCQDYNMKINIDKTEVMTIARTEKTTSIFIEKHQLKQVKDFTYLGSIFSDNGRINNEIQQRCNKANQVIGQMSPILKCKYVCMDTKRALYNTIFLPTLCYQCQTWTMTSDDRRKITTTEMKCLRRMLGVSKRDRLRNEDIRKLVGTTPILNYIKKQQVKWFGHVSRLPTVSAPQMAMLHRHSGYKARGRPRKTWTTEIFEALKCTLYEAHTNARSRDLFLP